MPCCNMPCYMLYMPFSMLQHAMLHVGHAILHVEHGMMHDGNAFLIPSLWHLIAQFGSLHKGTVQKAMSTMQNAM